MGIENKIRQETTNMIWARTLCQETRLPREMLEWQPME